MLREDARLDARGRQNWRTTDSERRKAGKVIIHLPNGLDEDVVDAMLIVQLSSEDCMLSTCKRVRVAGQSRVSVHVLPTCVLYRQPCMWMLVRHLRWTLPSTPNNCLNHAAT